MSDQASDNPGRWIGQESCRWNARPSPPFIVIVAMLRAHHSSMGVSLRARFFIIHNPNAGPVARHLFHATLARMRRAGACAEIVETTRHGEGMKAIAEAAQNGSFDAVVAAGGDGTVHDAA